MVPLVVALVVAACAVQSLLPSCVLREIVMEIIAARPLMARMHISRVLLIQDADWGYGNAQAQIWCPPRFQ
jgi:hypothetical protein